MSSRITRWKEKITIITMQCNKRYSRGQKESAFKEVQNPCEHERMRSGGENGTVPVWRGHTSSRLFNLPTRECLSSVAQSCPTLFDPMNRSMPGLPVHHQLLEFTQLMPIESMMSSSHLIVCHPLLLLPSIFPSIGVFSNESALWIRWPKYWSFSSASVLPMII